MAKELKELNEMGYKDLESIEQWAEKKIAHLEISAGDANLDTIIKLQQLRIQAYHTWTQDCIAYTLSEMQEQRTVEHGSPEPSEGYQMFDRTMHHGLHLLAEYMDSYKGLHEMENMSEELKDVLSHFRTAALLWVKDFEMEDEEEEDVSSPN